MLRAHEHLGGRALLDDTAAVEEHDAVGDLAQLGTTLIIVTHEVGFAREVADRVVFLDGGQVVEQGAPAEVLVTPKHPRVQDFLAKVLA